MALDSTLLDLLVCPESREKLAPASTALVEKINAAVAEGKAVNRAGKPVTTPLDSGLVRADGKMLYAVNDDIPNLLVDEAIPLDAFE